MMGVSASKQTTPTSDALDHHCPSRDLEGPGLVQRSRFARGLTQGFIPVDPGCRDVVQRIRFRTGYAH